jgi:ABC-type lipoprotein release transport system permease subunit
LLIVGILILSTGLSYLVGITQASNGTVVEELQKRWKSSYHIVVRPPNTRSVTEEKNLLEPNYLSGLSGGISLGQYEKIKSLDNVEVAAPISMMGIISNDVTLGKVDITDPGIYRLNIIEKTKTGVDTVEEKQDLYFARGMDDVMGLGKEYGIINFPGTLSYGSQIMIAGVDPEAESKLVGLDKAVMKDEHSHYFDENDGVDTLEIAEGIKETKIPVLVSNKEYVEGNITYEIERLDLPFNSQEDQDKTLNEVLKKGGETFLKTQKGKSIENHSFTVGEAQKRILEEIQKPTYLQDSSINRGRWMAFRPSPVEYNPVSSPFKERWPFAYEITPYTVPEESLLPIEQSFRPVNMFSEDSTNWPRLKFDFKGVFDPTKLNISKDPLTELPMETYFPAKAQWVLNEEDSPVNPPKDMKPLNNPYGFLTKPPQILTTLDAAAKVLGDKPISAIRVNVADVEELNDVSEKKLNEVAKEIEEATGLITDITLGSSPQPALTHIPQIEGKESIGWVQQPWIKIGSSITIFQETKMGLTGVIVSVIVVAIVYVFSSNLIMMFARKKEFAVLLAMGWRPRQLSKMLFLESTILGLLVGLISWTILGFFEVANSTVNTSPLRLGLIGLFGLIIYWAGTIIPAVLVLNIRPFETMRSGDISKTNRLFKSDTVLGMSLNYLFAKWKRTLLSVISIAFPTGLLIFFLFVTFRLKGIMYATWLGEFVAMEVGSLHYIAMGVSILIAILTTAEIIWQNVTERHAEISVLKAMGWRNRNVRLLVLLEGGLTGILAGVLGLILSFFIIWKMYNQIPTSEIPFLIGTIIIPVATGLVGAYFPAEKATKIPPYLGLSGGVTNSKKIEKQFKFGLSVAGAILFVGLLFLLTNAIPEARKATNHISEVGNSNNSQDYTDGKVSKTADESEGSKQLGSKTNKGENAIEKIKESAYKTGSLGDSFGDEFKMSFGKLAETPEKINVKNNNELITIPVSVEQGGESGYVTYKPQSYKIIDSKGNEYPAKDMKVLEKENWKNNIKLYSPGKAKVLLTYEVPEGADIALVVENSFSVGTIIVEIN